MAGQDGQKANGGSRKETGKQWHMTGPHARPPLYNWPHTRPGAGARKGADVSQVAL
jgi:hypothetical protein